MKKKTYIYTDELNDDFATSKDKISPKIIDHQYKYNHSSVVWKTTSFLLYHFIATPIVYMYMKIVFKVKIKNKKALKKIKSGYILYGNHTQGVADAFNPTLLSFPKKANIIVAPDAVSIPIIRHLVDMLGGMPLSSTFKGSKNLLEEMKNRLDKNQAITIYPEAHIWPYYNKIRPFKSGSFTYPFMFDVPAVGFVITYKQRKIFKKLHPYITITIGNPIYPNKCKNKQEMRDKIYNFMVEVVEKEDSYSYKKYINGKELENDNNNCM